MLNNNGGLDPSAARSFSTSFGGNPNQNNNNAFGFGGNLQGLQQGGFGMQGALGGNRAVFGGLPASAAQQATQQNRFGGSQLGGMQHMGQFAQNPGRGGFGTQLGGNLAGQSARGAFPGGTGMNSSLGPGRPGTGIPGLNVLGGALQRGNTPSIQGAGMPFAGGQRSLSGSGSLTMSGLSMGGLGGGLGLQGSPGRAGAGQAGLGPNSYNPSADLLSMMGKAGPGANMPRDQLAGLANATNNAFGMGGPAQQQGQTQQAQAQHPGLGQQQHPGAGQQQAPGQAQQQQQSSLLGSGQHGLVASGAQDDQPVFNQAEFPALGGGGNARGPGQGQGQAGQGSLPNGDSSSLGSVGTAADLYNNLTLQNKGVGGQLRSEFSVQEADFPALSGTTGQRQGEEQDGQKGGQFGARLGGQPVQAQPQRQPSQGGGSESAFGSGVMLRQPGARTEEERQQLMREAALQQRMVGQGAAAKGAALGQQLHGAGLPGKGPGPQQPAPDRFGLLGLLSVIRMTDPDLTTLALGTDLTTLGLHLNSPENVYRTFQSPWVDNPLRPEPEFRVPACYQHNPPRLQPGYFNKFQQDTLFYIFYSMPNDEAQLFAADELAHRGWWYHREGKTWLTRIPNTEPLLKTDRYERGSYFVFDTSQWECIRKDNFTLHYDALERQPNLPRSGLQPGAANLGSFAGKQ